MVLLNFIASLVLKILHNLFASLEITDKVNKITKMVQSDLPELSLNCQKQLTVLCIYMYVYIYIHIYIYKFI